eukprot:1158297-Pelagomonas_calceolata.AAC.3
MQQIDPNFQDCDSDSDRRHTKCYCLVSGGQFMDLQAACGCLAGQDSGAFCKAIQRHACFLCFSCPLPLLKPMNPTQREPPNDTMVSGLI